VLKENNILHFRGSRGGKNKSRHIESLVTNSSLQAYKRNITQERERCLTYINSINDFSNSKCNRTSNNDYPNLYVINAASLAKPHAVELLSSALSSLLIDVAIITETHFKKYHHLRNFDISGYNYIRRDRIGRKGGGVAIYVKEGIDYNIVTPHADTPEYETLWLNIVYNNLSFIYVAVYHPPQPVYDISSFRDFLSTNIEDITSSQSSTLFVCGDFNQLSNTEIINHTGLQPLVTGPTRGSSCLDRIYTSSINCFDVTIINST
jgi:hypothetical protein